MAFQYVSNFNSFVPQATGQVIGYIRDPKKYRVNQYVQTFPSPKAVGVYYKLQRDDSVRLVQSAEHTWHDSADRPKPRHNQQRFDTVEFATVRRSFGTVIGWEAIEQADW